MKNIVNSLTSIKTSVRACDLQKSIHIITNLQCYLSAQIYSVTCHDKSTVLPFSRILLFLDQGPHVGRAA